MIQKKKIQKFVYNPKLNQIDMLIYRERLKENTNFDKVFKHNLTDIIKEEASYKIQTTDREHHFMIVVFGLTGKGKSTSTISLAYELFNDFKVDRIAFHNQQIIDMLSRLNMPDFVIRDENIEQSQYGSGSQRMKTQLEAATNTLRKRRISFIFIGVDKFELSAAQYYFQALDMDEKQRITRFAVIDPYTKNYLGAFYQKVLPDQHPLIKEYLVKKDQFMQSIIDMDYSKGKPVYQEIIDHLIKECDLNIYKTKKERRIFIKQKYSNLTNGETEELSTMFEIQLRNKEEQNAANI
jgi:hypothetical protein